MAHQKPTTPVSPLESGNLKAERSAPPCLNEIINTIERDDVPLDQQQQVLMQLYQLTLDAHQSETLDFLDPPDEAVALDFLDFVDALAAAPLFDDDSAQYQEVLLAARKAVSLMYAVCIAVLTCCVGA